MLLQSALTLVKLCKMKLVFVQILEKLCKMEFAPVSIQEKLFRMELVSALTLDKLCKTEFVLVLLVMLFKMVLAQVSLIGLIMDYTINSRFFF